MSWDFEANTPGELAEGVRPALLKGRVTATVASEKVQMMHLLESLALTSALQYPLRVRHTSNRVPDFQLEAGGRRIAVELTKINFQDIQHGRALQEKGLRRTLSLSSLYPKPGGPRQRPEVIKDGFERPGAAFPPSIEEENCIWLKEARKRLEAKTRVLAGKEFDHGDEDWLALVDTLGVIAEEAEGRRDDFTRLLAGFWKPRWFSRVFLQDNFYRWQMMFTASESVVLPA